MMTKSEFDELFKNGGLVIEHHTEEEWRHICSYVQSIEPYPNLYGIQYGHDAEIFPFAGCYVRSGKLTAFRGCTSRIVIPYAEFAAIINEESVSEFECQIDLEEVL